MVSYCVAFQIKFSGERTLVSRFLKGTKSWVRFQMQRGDFHCYKCNTFLLNKPLKKQDLLLFFVKFNIYCSYFNNFRQTQISIFFLAKTILKIEKNTILKYNFYNRRCLLNLVTLTFGNLIKIARFVQIWRNNQP